MKIHQIFFKNDLRNFCYLISFDNGVIYCIDPYRALEVVHYLKDHLNNQPLTAIINTHDHCDHFSGNEELVKIYQCPVMSHPLSEIPFKNVDLQDSQIIYQGGDWVLKTIYTPGHTMTHLGVLLKKNGIAHALFTGDCFFNAGVGNCHNGGDPEVLYETISTFFKGLNDDVLVYPGHEYFKRNLEFSIKYEPSNNEALTFFKKIELINSDEHFFINNMGTERLINLFLRLDNPSLKKSLNLENSNMKKVFLTLRKLRNCW